MHTMNVPIVLRYVRSILLVSCIFSFSHIHSHITHLTQETPLCYSYIQYGSDSCHTVYTQEMNGTMLDCFFFQIEKISTSKFQKCHH